MATRFTDTEGYFVSEASVYRLLKAHDLITSPAFVVIKAADAFKDKVAVMSPDPNLTMPYQEMGDPGTPHAAGPILRLLQ